MSHSRKSNLFIAFLTISLTLSIGFSVGVVYRSFQEENGSVQVNAKSRVADIDPINFSFRDVAANVLPVVVEVDTVQVTESSGMNILPFDLFGLKPDKDKENKDEKKREFRRAGLGSGVIVKKVKNTYYILTNNHVVEKADEMKVVLNDKSEFDATLVGRDERLDLALIEIDSDGKELPVAVIGDSDQLFVGDWVMAVGSPFGYMSTVTAGIVSAKGRRGPDSNISDFIQTDAAINSGNSGGALVNLNGEVVGINTWIATKTGDSAGLGFSIPINNAKKAIEDFISNGEVEYGWLGVSISDLNDDYRSSFGVTEEQNGAFINNLYIGSPADESGLQAGDFIINIDGVDVENADKLVRLVGSLAPGKKSQFTLIRNTKEMIVSVSIGKRKSQDKILSNSENLWPGISVAILDDDIKDYFQLDKSAEGIIIVGVDKGAKAAGGLRPGDKILSINDNTIATVADFYQFFQSGEERYMIEYERGGSSYYFGVKRK